MLRVPGGRGAPGRPRPPRLLEEARDGEHLEGEDVHGGDGRLPGVLGPALPGHPGPLVGGVERGQDIRHPPGPHPENPLFWVFSNFNSQKQGVVQLWKV